ncbi:MAG: hypothetical protein NZ900_09040 [Synergistetes bacterium]|nr:hypothetical protein [Synergistota bacterium]MDW8193062.1 hypothetical protein [Synergistota bacterium]
MKKSFLTLKMVIALFLSSLMVGIIFFSFLKILRLADKLAYSALVLSQDIRSLQLSSILSRDYSYLYIDFYSLRRYILRYPDSKVIERSLPQGVKIFSSSFGGTGFLSFSPSGSPLSGGYIGLSDGEKRLYVVIAVFTGRVRVTESLP